ncbi:MAG: hypothetical protein HZC11_07510 [Nitrospirae bacterium]|nr:hypothetical protein [Nitrospirota bacterium]
MKKFYVILILITAFVFSGCGKDQVKPSADSLTAKEALRIMDVIKTAYEGKDQDALRENLSPELAASVIDGLFFEKAELSFTTRLVKITDSAVMVNLNWNGMWVIKNKTLKDIGSGVLVFQSRTMKLVQIEGDNPFHTPLVRER